MGCDDQNLQNLVRVVPEPCFMQLPSSNDLHDHHAESLEAISPEAVAEVVCASCAWLHWQSESVILDINHIPHSEHLHPIHLPHPAHVLINGMILEPEGIIQNDDNESNIHLCRECLHHLSADKLPPFSLSNQMWIGPVPEVLSKLTMPEQLLIAPVYPWCFIYKLHPKSGSSGDPTCKQSGLWGNVTTFPMNTDNVIEMLEGGKLPWSPSILTSVLAITYIGVGQLPKNWLKSTFRVWWQVVIEALRWLIHNNKCFSQYVIDEEILGSIPEDDIPVEIIASVHQETRTNILESEHDTYVPEGCKSFLAKISQLSN